MLAKIQGAQRKRQREEDEEMEMEMDDEEGSDAWSDDDAMDVDAGSRKVVKKQKTVSGGVVSKREPRSDRSIAGFKNEQVSLLAFWYFCVVLTTNRSAIQQGSQAAQSWATTTKHARQSW